MHDRELRRGPRGYAKNRETEHRDGQPDDASAAGCPGNGCEYAGPEVTDGCDERPPVGSVANLCPHGETEQGGPVGDGGQPGQVTIVHALERGEVGGQPARDAERDGIVEDAAGHHELERSLEQQAPGRTLVHVDLAGMPFQPGGQ